MRGQDCSGGQPRRGLPSGEVSDSRTATGMMQYNFMYEIVTRIGGGPTRTLPLPRGITRGTVYHYTNSSGLLGILSTSTLWASSPLSLNDLTEIEYGLDIAQEVWASWPSREGLSASQLQVGDSAFESPDSFLPTTDFVYLFCCCSTSDSLNQWRNYAGGQGFALGLDVKQGLTIDPINLPSDPTFPQYFLPGWYAVVYDPTRQREHVADLIRFVFDMIDEGDRALTNLVALLRFGVLSLAAQFKHPAFHAEEEVRFIACTDSSFSETFRVGPFGLVPYIHLTGRTDEEESFFATKNKPLPLTDLRLGPVNEQEKGLLLRATSRLLRAHSYDIPIEPSNIPYR